MTEPAVGAPYLVAETTLGKTSAWMGSIAESAALLAGYGWAIFGAAASTLMLIGARGSVHSQSSLLFLQLVIAVAIRFGFRRAVLGAVFDFGWWVFFFISPLNMFQIANARHLVSQAVFTAAAPTPSAVSFTKSSRTCLSPLAKLGITSMFERCAKIDVRLEMCSEPDDGTSIDVKASRSTGSRNSE